MDASVLIGLENGKLLKVDVKNTSGSLDKSDVTVTDITGSSFVGSISDIEFGQTTNGDDKNKILVTFHNYGAENIFYSFNGGSSWEAKEGDLPNFPVRTILMNPIDNKEVIVGTDLGVWYTKNFDNNSPSWLQGFIGMSNVSLHLCS